MGFRHNSYLALKNLPCDDHDGALVLRGCLPNDFLEQVAQESLPHLEEVKRLDNQMEGVTPASQTRQNWSW